MSDDAKAKESQENPAPEGLNKGLIAALVAALAAGAVALGYFFNVISDQIVGLLVAGAFALVLALLVMRIGLDLVRPALRYASVALVLGMVFVTLYPAKVALHLGHPDASATLNEGSSSLPLPSGGAYHVMVSGKLQDGREARIGYRLKAGDGTAEGALERQYMTRRARRGAAIQVPEDHALRAHEVKVPGSDPRIVLDQITGGQQVLVQAYSVLPPYLLWAAMALVLLLGMFLEVKAPSSGTLVMAAASAACFDFILNSADPSDMAWATLMSALLSAGAGAVLGSVLGAVGKRLFKAEIPGPKGKAEKKASQPDEVASE